MVQQYSKPQQSWAYLTQLPGRSKAEPTLNEAKVETEIGTDGQSGQYGRQAETVPQRGRYWNTLVKLLGPEVKLLPGTTAAKTAEIELTSPVIFLSLSTMNEAERDVNASKESKLHVGLGPQSGHTKKETRDSDLKLTRLRTPPTTTNTTPKSRGVILR